MVKRKVKINEIPSELGAGTRGASLGPAAVRLLDAQRGGQLFSKFPSEILFSYNMALNLEPKFNMAKRLEAIYKVLKKNSELLEFELEEGNFPLILSGDHSNALAGIAALANYYSNKRIGVIWIDAHADLHTPYTSPSGNIHGMPLGAALGEGYRTKPVNKVPDKVRELWTKLTTIGSKGLTPMIHPSDLVFIDIRDVEVQEWEDIVENKIKYYTPDDIQKMTMAKLGAEVLDYLKHCDYIYCSFDVDSMDPSVSSGTGTSVENGLSLEQSRELIRIFWESPLLKMLEITEINPLLDENGKMAEAVLSILDNIFPPGK